MSIYLRTEKIIPEWTDYNGHMNLAFYIHLFDQGWDVLLDRFQMGGESAKNEKKSTFAVESHTKYIQEVKEGDEVEILLTFFDHDKKRLHFRMEMIEKKTKKRLIPSFTANSYAQINEFGEMKRNSPDSEFSLGGIYEIAGSNLEFTINPDFSNFTS